MSFGLLSNETMVVGLLALLALEFITAWAVRKREEFDNTK